MDTSHKCSLTRLIWYLGIPSSRHVSALSTGAPSLMHIVITTDVSLIFHPDLSNLQTVTSLAPEVLCIPFELNRKLHETMTVFRLEH